MKAATLLSRIRAGRPLQCMKHPESTCHGSVSGIGSHYPFDGEAGEYSFLAGAPSRAVEERGTVSPSPLTPLTREVFAAAEGPIGILKSNGIPVYPQPGL